MSWTDEQMLMALHMREMDGLKMETIAQRLGKSKNAVVGMVTRLLAEANRPDPTSHLNGSLGPLWWQHREGKND